MTLNLPRPDQPDTYSGIRNRTRVRWVSVDVTELTAHLCTHTGDDEPHQLHGTYCTRLNPRYLVDLAGCRTTNDKGTRRFFFDRRGATVGDLLHGPLFKLRGQFLTLCSHCLTLAVVQAEMRGQTTYPVVSLCRELQRLPDQQHQA